MRTSLERREDMGGLLSDGRNSAHCQLSGFMKPVPDILLSGPARCLPPRNRPSGSPMRNLLGRLHARRLPELLRIAEAWGVPLYVESKSEVVGALYRAMIDPRTMRDVWDRLDPADRAMVVALTDAPDEALAPTLDELATRLGVAVEEVRETALR